MNLTKIISACVVAAGLICSGAYAQTSDSAEGKTRSQALLMAQGSPPSGGFTGNPFRGVVDRACQAEFGTRKQRAEVPRIQGRANRVGAQGWEQTAGNMTPQGRVRERLREALTSPVLRAAAGPQGPANNKS